MIKIKINIIIFWEQIDVVYIYMFAKMREGDLHCIALLAYRPFSYKNLKKKTKNKKKKKNIVN